MSNGFLNYIWNESLVPGANVIKESNLEILKIKVAHVKSKSWNETFFSVEFFDSMKKIETISRNKLEFQYW